MAVMFGLPPTNLHEKIAATHRARGEHENSSGKFTSLYACNFYWCRGMLLEARLVSGACSMHDKETHTDGKYRRKEGERYSSHFVV